MLPLNVTVPVVCALAVDMTLSDDALKGALPVVDCVRAIAVTPLPTELADPPTADCALPPCAGELGAILVGITAGDAKAPDDARSFAMPLGGSDPSGRTCSLVLPISGTASLFAD